MSLVKKFATVGGATLGSRVLGFARETLMAAALALPLWRPRPPDKTARRNGHV